MERKKLLFFVSVILILITSKSIAIDYTDSIKVILIGKNIQEFKDSVDLSSPLNTGVACIYNVLKNKGDYFWKKISSNGIKYYFNNEQNKSTTNDYLIKTKVRVEAICCYHDSLAYLLENNEEKYRIWSLVHENDGWKQNGSNNGFNNLNENIELINNKMLPNDLIYIRKYWSFCKQAPNVDSLVDFIRKNGLAPSSYLMNKLKRYRLTIFGEIHHRPWSWNLLNKVIINKNISKKVGVVFMELGCNKQALVDEYMSSESLTRASLVAILQEYMLYGWDYREMIDFIDEIRTINHQNLKNKIRIVLVDTPRNWPIDEKEFPKVVEAESNLNRDDQMASLVLTTLDTLNKNKNALFIVGAAHAAYQLKSASSILRSKLPNGSIFSIYTHSPRIDNFISIPEMLRFGSLDFAFNTMKNIPVAFDLKNSIWGYEPFDALYYDGGGCYEDNFDGYIFLGSLKMEPHTSVLNELYTDQFIIEMERRCKLLGVNNKNYWQIDSINVNSIINKMKNNLTKFRWEYLFKE
jgi:hypothetical protein